MSIDQPIKPEPDDPNPDIEPEPIAAPEIVPGLVPKTG
jgi:hypothetical protein